MTMRHLSDRARAEGVRALRAAVERVRGQRRTRADLFLVGASWSDGRDADEQILLGPTEAILDEVVPRDAEPTADEVLARALPGEDVEQTKALHRIADSIERLSAQLDAYHQERAEHLDAVEFLLREMVIGTISVLPVGPVVLGGVIDPGAIDLTRSEVTIIAEGCALEVDTSVEVRSRFHDRWVLGFTIAEAVEVSGVRC
ncbi:MAG: hypothetical protein ACLPVY_12775 [Acidimicrobiia bacterium]